MGNDIWAAGDAYESYVGRWSRRVAVEFVDWLPVPPWQRWADIGCGTGALSAAIARNAEPIEVTGVDPSEGFISEAKARLADPRVSFEVGDAQALPLPDKHFGAVVGGLMLNFVPDPARAVAEFTRVAAPGATVAVYVWDYAGDMQMMRYFWDAASALDPAAVQLDEGRRFGLCRPEALRALWTDAGLAQVQTHAIDVAAEFADFDDYWRPFLGGTGTAPGYVASLSEAQRDSLRDRLQTTLPRTSAGKIDLNLRAWAVKGINP